MTPNGETRGKTKAPSARPLDQVVERVLFLRPCPCFGAMLTNQSDDAWKAEARILANAIIALRHAQETPRPQSPHFRLSLEIASDEE
jgi:hypothetical protein